MTSIRFLLLTYVLTAAAQYNLVDDYAPSNFASKFNFFTDNDPTNGYVNYVSYDTAQASGLYSATSSQVRIGVDDTNVATGRGRDSVRIESKTTYDRGLFVLDLSHMPGSVCGTWPAFWLLGANWPDGGEIDIIEGVNSQNYNTMAAHTDAGCSIANTGGMSGTLVTSNCDVNAANQAANQGCSIKTSNTETYGDGFNAAQGGVYATEWTSDAISIWFFPRSAIPADLTSGNPDPSGWGLPLSKFAGACDWDEKMAPQQIIFDVTFCGDWAGPAFTSDTTCSSKASTCQAYVQNNPTAFTETYWAINSLKVFQEGAAGLPSTSSSVVSATTASSVSTTPSTLITRTTVSQVTTTGITSSSVAGTLSLPGSSTTTTAATTSQTFGIPTTTSTTTILTTSATTLPFGSLTATFSTTVSQAATLAPAGTVATTSYPSTTSWSWTTSSYTSTWTNDVASPSWGGWPNANSAPAQNPWNGGGSGRPWGNQGQWGTS